jgi:hypothetical protein
MKLQKLKRLLQNETLRIEAIILPVSLIVSIGLIYFLKLDVLGSLIGFVFATIFRCLQMYL